MTIQKSMLRAAFASAVAVAPGAMADVPADDRRTLNRGQDHRGESAAASHPYVGMWVTADGYIRQELLPNGRYDEARGNRKSAYQGRYEVTGTHIEYWDDTGFTADGDFVDGVLHHGGMVFYREGTGPAAR